MIQRDTANLVFIFILISAIIVLGSMPGTALGAQSKKSKGHSERSIKKKHKKENPLRLGTLLVGRSNLEELDSAKHQANAELWLMPSVKASDVFSLGGLLILDQRLKGTTETSLAAASLTARRAAMPLIATLSFSPAITAGIPLAKNQRDIQLLVMTASVRPRVLFNLKDIGLAPFSGHIEISGKRSFHESPIAVNGKSNFQYGMSNWLNINTAFSDQLSLTLDFVRSTKWTYEGNPVNHFEIGQELGFQINKTIGLAVGHTNAGGILKDDAVTSNVALFDERNSSIYGSLSMKY